MNAGNVNAAFKTSIENNSIECFKRKLKPEIEQRLENANDMEHIVQNAIKSERLVEARTAIRKEGKNKVEGLPQPREIRKSNYVSQVFKAKENADVRDTYNMRSSVAGQYCNKVGQNLSSVSA